MPNINFELNLNKHPKDTPNRSLVAAKNVRVSNDFSCLQNEESIFENNVINNIIGNKEIVGVIPCNKEFILFVKTDETNLSLYRYRETSNENINDGAYDEPQIKEIYKNFKYHGGKIKGTFTYNIKSHLILAISEYDCDELIPLKTLDVGTWDNDFINNDDTDLSLTDNQISLNPEIKIPEIIDFNYVNGLAYKGWYTFFIRYKINNNDYTKWYNVGFPIFVDELEKVSLFNYFIKSNAQQGTATGDGGLVTFLDEALSGEGIIDYISSNSNTCNKTINLNINHNSNNFKYYQIGIVCSTKDNQQAFKTLDIDINKTSFLLNFNSLEEYSVNDLTFERYNYYDVKTITNYKNRLYLANYNENTIKVKYIDELKNKVKFNIDRKEYLYKSSDDEIPIFSSRIRASCLPQDGNIENNENHRDSIECSISAEGESIYSSTLQIWANIGKSYSVGEQLVEVFYKNIDFGSEDILHIDIENTIVSTLYNSFVFTFVISGNCTLIKEGDSIRSIVDATLNINIVKNNVPSNFLENYHYRLKNTTLIPGETYNFYIHFVNKYGEFTEGILMSCNNSRYCTINNDGSITIDGGVNNKYIDIKSKVWIYSLNLVIDDYIDVNDYIGFFITYEKFQKTKQFCGIVTRYDFPYSVLPGPFNRPQYYKTIDSTDGWLYVDDDKQRVVEQDMKRTSIPDAEGKYKFRFYCTDIDVQDVLELNFTKLIVESKGFNRVHIKNYRFDEDTSYSNNGNINAEGRIFNLELNVLSAKYVSAHNFSKENDYRGSYIELELENAERLIDRGVWYYNIYKAVLISNSENLYLAQNKTLIKFTNTYYFDNISNIININKGLPGFCTFNTALIYNNHKVILNTGFNIFVNKEYKSYIYSTLLQTTEHKEDFDEKVMSFMRYPFAAYYTFIDYNNYPFESKRFKTFPEIVSIRNESIKDDVSQALFSFTNAIIVQPMNSIDLFENKIGSYDNVAVKIYTNFIKESIGIFNKRVIRSNPIADESFENNWRIFSPEAYKDITENKGNITNLVAMGTTMLVHTEHSLFMFDRDNTLQNGQDEKIQLAMPDIFDVDYKEVFSSYLGTCGLQDKDAWILDEFGYVFYDNDAHRIYKFGSKKIDIIDLPIIQFLDRFKPNKIKFFNDEERNRILIYIKYSEFNNNYIKAIDKELMLSYNHAINKWISEHDYIFDEGFSTKQQLYIINKTKNKIFNFNFGISPYNNSRNSRNIIYNYFDILDNDKFKNSTISVIINDSYELMKTLDYITWKLYKIKETQDTQPAREKIRTPYSGFKLRVYNDNIDTGYININITDNTKNKSVMNYKKPWWQYDNWNFNYLRDIKNSTTPIAQLMSRLYGNYFIIELQLNDVTISNHHERIEFETLNCQLVNNLTI